MKWHIKKYEMIHWINMKWYYWKAMVKTLKKRASMAGSAVCPLENNPLSIISHFYNLCLPIFVKYICSICKKYFSRTVEHICKIHNTYFRNSPLSMISHFYNLCLPIFVQVLLKWLLRPISCMFWTNLAPPISLPLQWNFKKKSWQISPFFYFWEISQNSVLFLESGITFLKDSGQKVYCTTPQESKCQRRKLNI